MESAWHIDEVAWPADTPTAVAALAGDGELAWLDSASTSASPKSPQYSLLCVEPAAILEQYENQPAHYSEAGRLVSTHASGWDAWRIAADRAPRLARGALRLTPGWVGYVGFEMARQLERLPATRQADLGLPLMRLARFDRAIVLDHERRQARAVSAEPARPDHADWLARWRDAARARTNKRRTDQNPTDRPRLVAQMPRTAHTDRIRRALDYIAAGDIYQVNLAQRLQVTGLADALHTYAAVRQANPAGYSALLRWGAQAVASFSPELFLSLRGRSVLTRPIKGTRPRTGIPAVDAAHRHDLLASPKEAAELTMIVDLHRNDLGRVCRPGSVRVTHPRGLESHPTVYHTVADIVGELRPNYDGLELLKACFPAGSISGVPKIRALQIIDELEPFSRGAYTGAVGVWGLDGQITFNVAIRTLQINRDTATLYVGGGIVADSDPAAEYAETLDKARGILRGLGVEAEPQATRRKVHA